MAKLSSEGIEKRMEELSREAERLERKATEMLGEAGKVVVEAWQDTIRRYGHVKTGDMLKSVRASKPTQSGGVYTSSIYPHGRDRKKQSNATKAFVLHYGTSRIRGSHFVDEAEEKAEDAVLEAMERVWQSD